MFGTFSAHLARLILFQLSARCLFVTSPRPALPPASSPNSDLSDICPLSRSRLLAFGSQPRDVDDDGSSNTTTTNHQTTNKRRNSVVASSSSSSSSSSLLWPQVGGGGWPLGDRPTADRPPTTEFASTSPVVPPQTFQTFQTFENPKHLKNFQNSQCSFSSFSPFSSFSSFSPLFQFHSISTGIPLPPPTPTDSRTHAHTPARAQRPTGPCSTCSTSPPH